MCKENCFGHSIISLNRVLSDLNLENRLKDYIIKAFGYEFENLQTYYDDRDLVELLSSIVMLKNDKEALMKLKKDFGQEYEYLF